MDRKKLDKILGIIALTCSYGITAYIMLSSFMKGFNIELLWFLLPSTGLFVAGKLFEKNSKIDNFINIEKYRIKYIKAMENLALGNELTPKMTRAISKYDKITKKQFFDNFNLCYTLFQLMEKESNFKLQVDYENLTFDKLPSSNHLQLNSVTCHYNSFDNFLNDQSKKVNEYFLNLTKGKDIELKITYHLEIQNIHCTPISHTHTNPTILSSFDLALKALFPNSFKNSLGNDYNKNNEQLTKYKNFDKKQDEHKCKNKDDEMTK